MARFASAALFGRPQLLGVGWAVTHRCNARCPFCDRHSGPEGMDTPTALDVIDQLAEVGCRRLHFTGGEPLLRRDLAELLRRARARGLTTTVNTNATLLSERPEVVTAADAFLVSVDGPAEIHDRYRGSGAFRRLERGLETLGEQRRPFLLSVTLFRDNLGQMPFFLSFARRCGTRIVLQPGATHVLGSSAPNPEVPDVERYRAVMRSLLQNPASLDVIWNSPRGLRELSRWPERHRLRPHAGRVSARLEVDGRLYPCSRSVNDPSTNPAPNVLQLGVAEAFERMPRIDCSEHVCQCAHNVEKGLLFELSPSAWWQQLTRSSVDWRRTLG